MIDFAIFSEKFTYYFNNYGIGFDEKILNGFYIFTEELLSENEKYNLTAIKDLDGIIVKHYIDSVIALKYFDIPENSSVIDIGAGAGFPSAPMRIIRGDLKIAFLDGSNKKINFIKSTLNKINQDCGNHRNIYLCGRAEDAGKDIKQRETYDFAVSRAVAGLNILCELAAPLVKPGGFFIAYKSRNADEEIKEAGNAFKVLDLEIKEIEEFNISPKIITPEQPEDNKRVLLKIQKLKKTSPKYPRNFSNITKNPL